MKYNTPKTIWTVGHSTRSPGEFIAVLKSFDLQQLVDIRQDPGDPSYPEFGYENLVNMLATGSIRYTHLKGFGDLNREPETWSVTARNNMHFGGFQPRTDYSSVKTAISELELLASDQRTVLMCTEALWWQCRRSAVADVLKIHGWKVIHIMGKRKALAHRFINNQELLDELFQQ